MAANTDGLVQVPQRSGRDGLLFVKASRVCEVAVEPANNDPTHCCVIVRFLDSTGEVDGTFKRFDDHESAWSYARNLLTAVNLVLTADIQITAALIEDK